MQQQEYQQVNMRSEQMAEITTTDIDREGETPKIVDLNIDPNRPKYGNMISILDSRYIKINLGPDYVCFLIAFLFFCALAYILCKTVSGAIKNQIIVSLTYIISISQCSSYLLVAISNPGVAFRQNNTIAVVTEQNRFRVCKRCGAQKKRKTYHCRQCDVCIQDYDHHCPWTSKCIGKGNLYQFYAFVTITPIYILFFIGLMMGSLVINAQQAVKNNHLRTGTL